MHDAQDLINAKPKATTSLEFALGVITAILGFLVLVAGILIAIF